MVVHSDERVGLARAAIHGDARLVDGRRIARISWYAERQLGLFTRAQALAAGYPRATVDRRVRSGRWRRWHSGVYSHAGLPTAWRVELLAAVLAVGDDAVVGGRSAACLWQLPDLDHEGPVQLVVPRPKLPRIEGVTVLGTSALNERETVRFGVYQVTTVTRTLRDLTRSVDRKHLLECAADAWRRRLTSPDALADAVARRPRWPGNEVLRWVQGQLDPQYRRCRSLAEVRSHRALKGAGVHGYVVNARRTLTSGRRVELDVLWEERKRVVEIDGDAYHGSVTAHRRDGARDRDLEADGYRVLHVQAAVTDDPDAYVTTVRRFLAEP